jgi:hypothetical protein
MIHGMRELCGIYYKYLRILQLCIICINECQRNKGIEKEMKKKRNRKRKKKNVGCGRGVCPGQLYRRWQAGTTARQPLVAPLGVPPLLSAKPVGLLVCPDLCRYHGRYRCRWYQPPKAGGAALLHPAMATPPWAPARPPVQMPWPVALGHVNTGPVVPAQPCRYYGELPTARSRGAYKKSFFFLKQVNFSCIFSWPPLLELHFPRSFYSPNQISPYLRI